jgi:tRNA-specific 2-thiouridylase
MLATGHYARVERDGEQFRLRRAADPTKDQSYVLYGLGQEELARVTFPLGTWRKEDVREEARRLGLLVADKPDSVEICFVAGGDYRDLVARRAAAAEASGEIRHVSGAPLGAHAGVWNYTVGQRSGLGALPRGIAGPLFVTEIDAVNRVVTVGPRDALRREVLEIGGLSFVAGAAPAIDFDADVRVRYGAAPVRGAVRLAAGGDGATVTLAEPVPSAAPGQAAVLYDGETVLGGGRITRRAA